MTQHTLQLKAVLDSSEVKAELAKLQSISGNTRSDNSTTVQNYQQQYSKSTEITAVMNRLNQSLSNGNRVFIDLRNAIAKLTATVMQLQGTDKSVKQAISPGNTRDYQQTNLSKDLTALGVRKNDTVKIANMVRLARQDVSKLDAAIVQYVETLDRSCALVSSKLETTVNNIRKAIYKMANLDKNLPNDLKFSNPKADYTQSMKYLDDKSERNIYERESIGRQAKYLMRFFGGQQFAGELSRSSWSGGAALGQLAESGFGTAIATSTLTSNPLTIVTAGVVSALTNLQEQLLKAAQKIREASDAGWNAWKSAVDRLKQLDSSIDKIDFGRSLKKMGTKEIENTVVEAQSQYDAAEKRYRSSRNSYKEQLDDINKAKLQQTDDFGASNPVSHWLINNFTPLTVQSKDEKIASLELSTKKLQKIQQQITDDMDRAADKLNEVKSMKEAVEHIQKAYDNFQKQLDNVQFKEDLKKSNINRLKQVKENFDQYIDMLTEEFKAINAKNDKTPEDLKRLDKLQSTIVEQQARRDTVDSQLKDSQQFDKQFTNELKQQKYDMQLKVADKAIWSITSDKSTSVGQKLDALEAEWKKSKSTTGNMKRYRDNLYAQIVETDDIEKKRQLKEDADLITKNIEQQQTSTEKYENAMLQVANISKQAPDMSNVTDLAAHGYGMGEKDDAERLRMMQDHLSQMRDYLRLVQEKLYEDIDVNLAL